MQATLKGSTLEVIKDGSPIVFDAKEIEILLTALKKYKVKGDTAKYEQEFDELVWPVAFKKQGKEVAKKAYIKIRKDVAKTNEQRDDVLEAWRYVNEVLYQTQFKQKGRKQFIPLPSSWFNGQRWNDEDVQEGLRSRFVTGSEAPVDIGSMSKADQREYDHMLNLQTFYLKYQTA